MPAALASAALGTAACSAAEEESTEGRVGMVQSELQIAWVGLTESSTTDGVNLVKQSSQIRKGKATGAVRVAIGAARANCGSTFISNRRGITAAHCVDNYSQGQSFTVEQYNTQNLNLTKVADQSTVQGTWPNWSRPVKLTSADGYQVTSYTCTLERRCGNFGTGNFGCPDGAQGADVALFYCSTRSTAVQAVKNWVDIPNADTFGSFLDVWWFHELVHLQTADSGYEMPYQPDFNWDNYGYYNGNMANNFHYTQASTERHQLFPLRSTHSKQNVRYQSNTTPPLGSSVVTQSNVPVCHGTSGSGVFRYNTDELVGVVNTGGLSADGTSNVLCSDMDAVIGSSSMQYASTSLIKLLEVPEVTSERN